MPRIIECSVSFIYYKVTKNFSIIQQAAKKTVATVVAATVRDRLYAVSVFQEVFDAFEVGAVVQTIIDVFEILKGVAEFFVALVCFLEVFS